MGLSVNPAGPLKNATLYKINESIFWGPTNPPDIEPQDDDIGHIVTTSDRVDLLASRFLNDVQRMWIILHRNDMRLSPNDLVPGQKIFIPTLESLQRRGLIG